MTAVLLLLAALAPALAAADSFNLTLAPCAQNAAQKWLLNSSDVNSLILAVSDSVGASENEEGGRAGERREMHEREERRREKAKRGEEETQKRAEKK